MRDSAGRLSGLLYQGGYFRQYLEPGRLQQERYPVNDFFTLLCCPSAIPPE